MLKTAILFLIIGTGARDAVSAQSEPLNHPRSLDSALAARVAGCYELAGAGWRSDSEMAKIVRMANIASLPTDPIRFELTKNSVRGWTALSGPGDPVYFEVRTDSVAGWGRGLFTSWIRVAGTQPTILVSRPLPMAGFSLRLTQRGADLVGTITAFTDFIPDDGKSEVSHAITARRITCPHSFH
jgi:hypothetical protein